MNPLNQWKYLRLPLAVGVVLVVAFLLGVPIPRFPHKPKSHANPNPAPAKPKSLSVTTPGGRDEKNPASKNLTAGDYAIHLLPIDQNLSTNRIVIKGPDGRPEEFSYDSRRKAEYAITNFIANAKLAGLKFNPGDLVKPMRVNTIVNSSVTAQTEHVVFGAQFSPSGDVPPAVDYITSIGLDENGVNRDVNSLSAGGNSLRKLSDKNLYPINGNTDEVDATVVAFLNLQVPHGDYVLNGKHRLQAPLPLPFMVYEFVPPEEYKRVDPINGVIITVRDGGLDLKSGEAELVAYEDGGVVNRAKGQRRTFNKPSTSLLAPH